jgi:hypothetical protein
MAHKQPVPEVIITPVPEVIITPTQLSALFNSISMEQTSRGIQRPVIPEIDMDELLRQVQERLDITLSLSS